MKMLKNRLYQLEAEKQAKKKAELDATKSDVSFGSQIRSYVFQPYTMVNDHRTELKIPDVQRVMDGDIDPFIEAYLKQLADIGTGGERRRVSDDLNFVQRARREKLDALEAARHRAVRVRVRPHASRGRGGRAAIPKATRMRARSVRVAGRTRRLARAREDGVRASRRLRAGGFSCTSGRTCSATSVFALLELFDIGDVIGVDGPLFRTRTGEVTVRVDRVELLAKSLRPLPFGKEEVVDGELVRHSGFADPEQR